MKTILPSTLVVALVLAALPACQAENPDHPQVRKQARTEPPPKSGYRDLAEAETSAEARYDLSLAQADGELKEAREACEVTKGEERKACIAAAESEFASARAAARAERDAALTVAKREFRDKDAAA